MSPTLADTDASHRLGVTKRTIVPFVSHFKGTKPAFVCFSRGDEIHSCFEAAVELILVAAGVAGVIAAMMAGLS